KNLTEQFDVGIVLGGGMITFDKENNRLSFRDNVDRIMQAVRLYKSGKIHKILISGGSGRLLFRNMKESELLKDYFVEIGILSHDMIIETNSDNTYENAKYSSEILLNEYPESSYLLITSAIHMRRAKACFNKFDIKLSTYPTNKLVGKRRYQFSHMFVPDVNSLGRWNIFLHEFFGYLVYKVMGYA
ncbi:MAG: YdcF family protein, partial [Bacteroidales bacterium]|nr:YdcF family protein [Bacteroidales bacterium]